MNSKEKKIVLVLLILAGLVVGELIGELLGKSSGFEWLNFGETFGITKPLVLDFKVFVLTLGFTFKITISSIIGMLIGIFVYMRLR